MKATLRKTTLVVSLILLVIPFYVAGQETSSIIIDYREVQLVPDDFDSLQSFEPAFSTDPTLRGILDSNSTMFWTSLGQTGYELTENLSVRSYAICQVNASGFSQQIVGLSPEDGSLQWVESVPSELQANFSVAILEATEFFINDSRYWGLCEKIVLIPGSTAELEVGVVWKVSFYLVAETERWSLYLGVDGSILKVESSDIPCQSCIDYTPIIVVVLASIVAFPLGFFLFRNKESEREKGKLPESNAYLRPHSI
ncbi:hypothetical protein EU537_10520 [Candidatus Thorarchaeota archaeon]|nr:MAG: hypothetical protein EU537_10520 [Candidatus Thorarchaeota archaeon]